MGVTIKDVAKESGVSTSTVSRVMSESPRISDKTKKRVRDAIEKLNYHPNVIARSLANNETKVIGIVLTSEVEDLSKNPFFIQVMTGISTYAREKDYHIMYTFCKTHEEELKYTKDYVNGNLVDGIVLTAVRNNDKCIEYLKEKEFPFVVIGRPEVTKNMLWVDNDNFQAMYNLVNKLIDKGYKKIAYIGAKTELSVSKDRLSGYIQAHKINGIDMEENLIKEVNDFKEELGHKSMNEICTKEIPDALVAEDDLLAFGAIRYLKENNIKGVAVAGFNNTPLCEFQNPSLTSVDINVKKIGYYAAKLLVNGLENNLKEKHYIIETRLIERKSTSINKV